jgi:hypothetical protein
VGIDDHDMGRLSQANNHEAFNTLQPLAMKVEPGKTYLLKIVSYGDSKVDDFVIEGVSVETAIAQVRFLKPGPILKMPEEPMPVFSEAPAPASAEAPGPCPGLAKLEDWELGSGKSRDRMELKSGPEGFADSGVLGQLNPGQSVEFFLQSSAEGEADEVSRALELLCGGEKDSGWVLTLDASGRAVHGNLRKKGNYRAAHFNEGAFVPGGWNRLRLSYCKDGSLRLDINGSALSAALQGAGAPQPFRLRSLGQKTLLSGAQKFR